ncbi:MAG TPA: translation initiation factor IF-2 subunit alpha [Candidatus Poseidoniales archaeon]|nr:MAG TPA: translation initiation factor IF-2 subunit alpha [Candidatus Poseidoniales archaeon]HII62640.1 translation initiation factor IF-2 subunit alpha [Candidatus Poseidoniaceae archaeon]|tara:strand:+ start:1633 stop:2418 length:786 start_codon:yes stop_codon:yes gene_type:complete
MSDRVNTPEEGELVVVTVKNVKQNGVYVDFDEYPGIEGFIFIGEIASGWVKNIRTFVRDGQRLICKVMRTKKDGSSLELSLKSVSEERRRDRLQEWKNEQRSIQLLKVLGEKVGWDDNKRESMSEDLVSAFGTLYASFEEAAMNETSIVDAGFDGEWIKEFTEIAIENIIPPFVEIKGNLNLSINVENGVEVIKDALASAENYTSDKDEVSVMCFYNGAPEYRIVLKAPDFKTAEDLWIEVSNVIVSKMEEYGGQATCFRE